nr:ribonuclease H-like domain-containing protein [Tanacetum cinerariifolium]
PQVMSAAKLPILNLNEFDLGKMRIEQYLLMIDYSLWEVILNGDSPTRVIEDKHQLKFNIHKDTKTLMDAIEKRTHTLIWRNKTCLEEQSLDDLFNSLKIYKAEVKSSSSTRTSTQNIAFVSSCNTNSTNESVSVAASVSTVSAKIPIFALLNMDTLSNAVICLFFTSQYTSPQLDNDDLKQINVDDLEEMDLKWQAMLTVRARRFLQRTGRNLGTNGPTFIGFDMSKLRDNALVVLRQNLKKAEQERDDLKLNLPPSPIYDRYQSGDGYHVVPPPYTGTFMPLKPDLVFHNAPDINETVHTAFNIKVSPTKPENDLSHTHRPLTLIIEDWVFDSKDESETKIPHIIPSFVQPTEQVKYPRLSVQHVETSIPTANPKTAISKLRTVITKSKLVLINAARPVIAAVPKPHVTRPRPAKPIVTKPHSPPRRNINRSPSPKANDFPLKVTAVKVLQVNVAKGVQGKWEWKPKCPILEYVSHNTSASMTLKRFDYNDALGRSNGYVAFGGNPNGGKISSKGKIRTEKLDFDDVYFVKELKFNLFSVSHMCDKKNIVLFTNTECLVLSPEFKLPYENQVLLRFPRKNNMYNDNLKNIVPFGDLTCLFAKATLDESIFWHRRLGQ